MIIRQFSTAVFRRHCHRRRHHRRSAASTFVTFHLLQRPRKLPGVPVRDCACVRHRAHERSSLKPPIPAIQSPRRRLVTTDDRLYRVCTVRKTTTLPSTVLVCLWQVSSSPRHSQARREHQILAHSASQRAGQRSKRSPGAGTFTPKAHNNLDTWHTYLRWWPASRPSWPGPARGAPSCRCRARTGSNS